MKKHVLFALGVSALLAGAPARERAGAGPDAAVHRSVGGSPPPSRRRPPRRPSPGV